jgi:hypothetical protein
MNSDSYSANPPTQHPSVADDAHPDWTKVVFKLEQDDEGYPPAASESVWAKQIGDNRYRIENIPFFARNVSFGDVVETTDDHGRLMVTRRVDQSNHSTIRVMLKRVDDVSSLRQVLRETGCDSELSHLPRLIAVDIPPRVELEKVRGILNRGVSEGLWDYEESALAK